MIRGIVYKQAPGLWFGDVIEDDPEAYSSVLECVNESTHQKALDGTLDALARAYQRRQLWADPTPPDLPLACWEKQILASPADIFDCALPQWHDGPCEREADR